MIRDSGFTNNILENDNHDDPVTRADLSVNHLIINSINKKYKNISWDILSEENVKKISFNVKSHIDWLWILDPLDGTKDFIQGTGNYAMHLALNYKNVPYIGLVLIPEKDELWISNGNEVWCEQKNGSKRNFKMSEKLKLSDMRIVTSKNNNNENLRKIIEKTKFKSTTIMGSIGCKIASILRGESDIYISLSLPNKSSPKDWDFAAPEAILKASGGAITNIENQNLSYNESRFEHPGIIVASNNRENHQDICMQLRHIIIENNLYPFL